MAKTSVPKLNTQIYEEATQWFVEFRSGDADERARRAFSEWVRVSPEHVRAYLEIAAIWNEGEMLDSERRYGDKIAVELAEIDNVLPLAEAPRQLLTQPASVDAPRSKVTRRNAIAATLLIVGSSLFAWLYLNEGIYRAGIGEQRSLMLADGSMVQLNSRSRIQVHLTDDERRVELLEGQALFLVAKDSTRAFVVTSDGVAVRAVGTQFDVYKRPDGTSVTVLEGQVEVASKSSAVVAGAAVLLTAGEQLMVTPDGANEPRRADVVAATAWTQRRIVFDSATLSDVAQEFNRYNVRQIVLKDADMTNFHISGVFSSTDPTSLIRFLRERPGIEVVESEDEIQISRR